MYLGLFFTSHFSPLFTIKYVQSDLQEVAGVTIMALLEAGVFVLGQKVRNISRDLNVEAVQDGQDQLRPAESAT